jgi:hypothetical protein
MKISGCVYQVNVFEAREEMRKVLQALLVASSVYCALMDENHI